MQPHQQQTENSSSLFLQAAFAPSAAESPAARAGLAARCTNKPGLQYSSCHCGEYHKEAPLCSPRSPGGGGQAWRAPRRRSRPRCPLPPSAARAAASAVVAARRSPHTAKVRMTVTTQSVRMTVTTQSSIHTPRFSRCNCAQKTPSQASCVVDAVALAHQTLPGSTERELRTGSHCGGT